MKRIAIVTGASSGFGRDYALEIDRKFTIDEIWLIARREERLETLSSGLKNSRGVVIPLDLTDKNDLEKLKLKAIEESPDIKFLINNAGYGKTGAFEDVDIDYTMGMIDLNIKSLVYLTHSLLPFMKKDSNIINVASSAAFSPLPYFNVYAATKTFVKNFSYALREELKEKKINVLAVCPGPAATEFFDVAGDFKKNGIRIASSKRVVRRSFIDLENGYASSVYGVEMGFLRLVSALLPDFLVSFIAGKFKINE